MILWARESSEHDEGRCSRISRGTPEARSRLCVCRASFLMTYVMGGVPHDGSRATRGLRPPEQLERPAGFPSSVLGQEDLLEKGWAPNPLFLGFPCGSAGKESGCNVGDLGSIPGLGRSPGEGNGYPLQCSGLDPFGPRSQFSLQKAQGPGVCKLPKPPASRALCQAKRAPWTV